MTLTSYLQHRRGWEIGLWGLFLLTNWLAEVAVIYFDLERSGSDLPLWQPAVWEGSSVIVTFALLWPIVRFDERFTIARPQVRRALIAHGLFTIPFSLVHVFGMVGLRELVYAAVGQNYDFGSWPKELLYEYLKDFRSYWTILGFIYLYRFVIRRLQGEAGFIDEGTEQANPEPVTDRFLVKKLGREFLVRVADIEWVEASGNYVNLHVAGRIYPLRDTMTAIDSRLAPSGFLRVHRSAIVNLDQVTEIVPLEAGDAHVRLGSGQQIPVSRRYRQVLRDRVLA